MLADNTVSNATLIVEDLASKGIFIAPKEGSLLNNLNGVLSGDGCLVTRSVEKDDFDRCRHDAVMSESVNEVAAVVARNLALARSTVNPIICAILEKTETLLAQKEASASVAMQIVQESVNPIWNSTALLGLVERYQTTPFREVKFLFPFPELSEDALGELVVTGANSFDSAFADYVNMEELKSIYSTVFVFACGGIDNALTSYVAPVRANYKTALATLILARQLADNIPEGLNVELGAYRNFMAGVSEQAGRACCEIMARIARGFANKTLVNDWSTSELKVNAPVYLEWLKAGGEPEMLLGAKSLGERPSYDQALAQGDQYKRAYTKFQALNQRTIENQRFENTVVALRLAAAQVLSDQNEGVLPVTLNLLLPRVNEKFALTTTRELDNLADWIRFVICTVVFPDTEALKILTKIDELGNKYPDSEGRERELATLATIELVVGWIADHFEVQKLS